MASINDVDQLDQLEQLSLNSQQSNSSSKQRKRKRQQSNQSHQGADNNSLPANNEDEDEDTSLEITETVLSPSHQEQKQARTRPDGQRDTLSTNQRGATASSSTNRQEPIAEALTDTDYDVELTNFAKNSPYFAFLPRRNIPKRPVADPSITSHQTTRDRDLESLRKRQPAISGFVDSSISIDRGVKTAGNPSKDVVLQTTTTISTSIDSSPSITRQAITADKPSKDIANHQTSTLSTSINSSSSVIRKATTADKPSKKVAKHQRTISTPIDPSTSINRQAITVDRFSKDITKPQANTSNLVDPSALIIRQATATGRSSKHVINPQKSVLTSITSSISVNQQANPEDTSRENLTNPQTFNLTPINQSTIFKRRTTTQENPFKDVVLPQKIISIPNNPSTAVIRRATTQSQSLKHLDIPEIFLWPPVDSPTAIIQQTTIPRQSSTHLAIPGTFVWPPIRSPTAIIPPALSQDNHSEDVKMANYDECTEDLTMVNYDQEREGPAIDEQLQQKNDLARALENIPDAALNNAFAEAIKNTVATLLSAHPAPLSTMQASRPQIELLYQRVIDHLKVRGVEVITNQIETILRQAVGFEANDQTDEDFSNILLRHPSTRDNLQPSQMQAITMPGYGMSMLNAATQNANPFNSSFLYINDQPGYGAVNPRPANTLSSGPAAATGLPLASSDAMDDQSAAGPSLLPASSFAMGQSGAAATPPLTFANLAVPLSNPDEACQNRLCPGYPHGAWVVGGVLKMPSCSRVCEACGSAQAAYAPGGTKGGSGPSNLRKHIVLKHSKESPQYRADKAGFFWERVALASEH